MRHSDTKTQEVLQLNRESLGGGGEECITNLQGLNKSMIYCLV